MDDSRRRKEIEIAFQAESAQKKTDIKPTPSFIIDRFSKARLWRFFPKEYVFRRICTFEGKRILDFGCGDGEMSTQMAKMGARVTAIDISPELVQLARMRAALDKVDERIEFMAGDITESPMSADQFDHVVCYAVIHHVDIPETVPLLYSCLKRGGTAIMVEPAAFSPWLQAIIKTLSPGKDLSPVQRQLTSQDMDQIKGFFDGTETVFYEFLGRAQKLFPNRDKIDRGHPFTKLALVLIHGLDRIIISLLPFLWRFYGIAVIVGKKSRAC